jgi:hypothetical protein
MNVLKAIWEWLVWFCYKSPVRNFGVLGSMISGRGIASWLGVTLYRGVITPKCFLLAVEVELIDWLNSLVNPRS